MCGKVDAKAILDLRRKVLVAFGELLYSEDMFDSMTESEIDDILRDFGYDPDELSARMRKVADEALVHANVELEKRYASTT